MASDDDNPAAEISNAAAGDFDHEAYNYVAGSAELSQLILIASDFKIRVNSYPRLYSSFADLPAAFRPSIEECSFLAEDGMLSGVIKWSCEVKDGKAKALKFSASYLLVYSSLEDAVEEYTALYFEKVGKFATYPYFRSAFANHCASTGLAVPPLPALRERVD